MNKISNKLVNWFLFFNFSCFKAYNTTIFKILYVYEMARISVIFSTIEPEPRLLQTVNDKKWFQQTERLQTRYAMQFQVRSTDTTGPTQLTQSVRDRNVGLNEPNYILQTYTGCILIHHNIPMR
jgi:hypothetical protein